MKLATTMIFSAAALAAAPTTAALAADYDPPIYIEEAPEYVPVEIGSGWYLRGDIGYNFNRRFRSYEIGTVPGLTVGQDNTSLFGGVGFGHHFNDYLRAEANIGFLAQEQFQVSYADPFFPGFGGSAELKSEFWSGMLNGYVDLGTVAGLTPYVGGGIGVVYARSKIEGEVNFPDGSTLSGLAKQNHYSAAYSLGAGINYKVDSNTSIDLGYQYVSAPDAKFVSVDNPYLYGKGIEFHQIKVGLRYNLW